MKQYYSRYDLPIDYTKPKTKKQKEKIKRYEHRLKVIDKKVCIVDKKIEKFKKQNQKHLTQRNRRHKLFLYEKGESFMQTTLATFFWATIVLLIVASLS